MVRLVKGAYWDTEIKRAQERGLAGLSGVHPQGDDRPLLPRLHAQAVGGAAAALSAVRHPQRAHRRERDRGCGRRRGLSSSSACTAWARCFTRRSRANFRKPRAGSMRRSAATAICWPIWCGGCWRTAPTPRSCRSRPIRRCRSRRILRRPQNWIGDAARRRGIRTFRCRAISMRPTRRNSAGVEFGDRAALAALLAEVRGSRTAVDRPVDGGTAGMPHARSIRRSTAP